MVPQPGRWSSRRRAPKVDLRPALRYQLAVRSTANSARKWLRKGGRIGCLRRAPNLKTQRPGADEFDAGQTIRFPNPGNGVLTPALTQARVMVVDDHPANLLLVRRILGQAGFAHVRGYKDSRSALESWRSWDPDVILLDLHMPHLDGVAFLETLRRSIPDR